VGLIKAIELSMFNEDDFEKKNLNEVLTDAEQHLPAKKEKRSKKLLLEERPNIKNLDGQLIHSIKRT